MDLNHTKSTHGFKNWMRSVSLVGSIVGWSSFLFGLMIWIAQTNLELLEPTSFPELNGSQFFFFFLIFWSSKWCRFDLHVSPALFRNDNGAGSGRVAPIPTPPRLLKTILIIVPFKKLNGVGQVCEFSIPTSPHLVFFFFFF